MNFIEEIILADRDNCKGVANSLKESWIIDTLQQTGMNLENCLPENEEGEQTIDQKAQFRKNLDVNEILILREGEEVKIYIQDILIGEWKKPFYTLRSDLSQLNPKKKVYVEIKIEYWSVFYDEVAESQNEF